LLVLSHFVVCFSSLLVIAACKGRDESADRAAEPPADQPSAAPPFLATKADPPAAALTADEQATIEKVMEARDEMAGIAEALVGDCDKAAREIEALIDRSRALLTASSRMEGDPAKRAWIGEKYGARLLASSSKLMALFERCDQHEGLARIFESLE